MLANLNNSLFFIGPVPKPLFGSQLVQPRLPISKGVGILALDLSEKEKHRISITSHTDIQICPMTCRRTREAFKAEIHKRHPLSFIN